jgi:hypothetical protein
LRLCFATENQCPLHCDSCVENLRICKVDILTLGFCVDKKQHGLIICWCNGKQQFCLCVQNDFTDCDDGKRHDDEPGDE